MMPAEPCSTKTSLMANYSELAQAYTTALADLRGRMGTLNTRDYGHRYAQTEYVRMDMESARLNLERHVAEHGC
jgi:hypothetical protein